MSTLGQYNGGTMWRGYQMLFLWLGWFLAYMDYKLRLNEFSSCRVVHMQACKVCLGEVILKFSKWHKKNYNEKLNEK